MKKQTIVIFEGHDKAGKTTIANALAKELDLTVFKVTRDKYFWDPVSYQTYATEAITQIIEKTGLSVILDRSFASDHMYSKLFKRPYNYSKGYETADRFGKLDALIVLCYKDKISYLDDPEDAAFISTADYDKMTEIYLEFLGEIDCRYIIINTSDHDLDKQLQLIKNNL